MIIFFLKEDIVFIDQGFLNTLKYSFIQGSWVPLTFLLIAMVTGCILVTFMVTKVYVCFVLILLLLL